MFSILCIKLPLPFSDKSMKKNKKDLDGQIFNKNIKLLEKLPPTSNATTKYLTVKQP